MSDATEEWRPIPGFEGHYEASSLGRVRSLKRGAPYVLAQTRSGNGYLVAMISMGGKYRPYGIHRLVCMAFYGSPPDGAHACHHDGDRTNNVVSNLRWDTARGNADDMRRHGRHRNGRKTHCKRGHEFTSENTYIQPSRGIRRCRACAQQYNREYFANSFAAQHVSKKHPTQPLAP